MEDMRYDVELQSSNNRRIAALIAKALRHTCVIFNNESNAKYGHHKESCRGINEVQNDCNI